MGTAVLDTGPEQVTYPPGQEAADEAKVDVLLVDDSPGKLDALEALLNDGALNLVRAESGAVALRQLLRREFALVLLDVNMPGLDGFETAALIRGRPRFELTPIIFITAYDADDARLTKGYGLGAVDFLFAPVRPATLKAKVDVFVHLHRARRQVSRQAESLRAHAAQLEEARLGLAEANGRLEAKVSARTEALVELNRSLEREVAERKVAQERLTASLAEKDALLKEVHHRVKNNLQIISSLLRLQSGRHADGTALDMLQDSRNRIRAMALVHEKLYGSSDLARIDLGDYLDDLSRQLFRAYDGEGRSIALTVDVESMEASVDMAIPTGMVVNELVSNALKHAFPSGKPPAEGRRHAIGVRGRRDGGGGGYRLEVADNGIGLPAGMDSLQARTLGMQLVKALTKQLGGSLEISRIEDGGMRFQVRLPGAGTGGDHG